MKHLIFAVLLLAACSKPNITTYETKEIFYKLQEVDKDGKVIYETETRSIDVTTQSKISDGDCDDDDEDDDDDNPLPITINTFAVTKVNSNTIRLCWEATNEDNVSHYNILKSIDTQSWNKVIEIKKGSGKYEYIDKF
jgi:hypothetical protein